MPQIEDRVDRNSADFTANRDDLQGRVNRLRQTVERIAEGNLTI